MPHAKPRVFVCELLGRPASASRVRRLLRAAWTRLVEGPLLRRGMAAAQTMTAWERHDLIAMYGIEQARLHRIPWPLREGGDTPPAANTPDSRAVFSSGRTACDWETLMAAADGAGWDLTVVCSHTDAERVRRLAAEIDGVRVEVELPWTEHDRLLRASAVCVIAIVEVGLSAGQVRLMSAVEAGVPVVASAVRALGDEVRPGTTAQLVEPGDPSALRVAVDRLLGDPERRQEARDRAREDAARSTYAHYFDQLREVIGKSLPGVR
jgi:hypothetical protein